MAYSKDQLTALQKEASNYGGFTDQKFIDYVNQKGGAGSYDTLKSNIEAMQKPAPVSTPIDTTTGQEVVKPQPIVEQPTTPPQPIAEAPKVEPMKVEPTEAPKTTDQIVTETASTPKWQTEIDKALETTSISDLKTKLATGGLDARQTAEINRYLSEKQTKEEKAQEQQNAMLNNPDNIFSGLLQGQTFANTNTPEFKQAKTRFDSFNKYRSYSTENFQIAMSNGNIIQGTQTYNDLIKDPAIKQKIDNANKLNQINGVTTDINTIGTTQSEEILSKNSNIATALADGMITQAELDSMTNSEDLRAKAVDVEAKKNKYETLKAEYDNIELEIEEQLKGTGATTNDKNQMIYNAQKGLMKRLEVAESEYRNAYGTYTDMKSSALDLFNTNLGLYKEAQAKQEAQATLQEQRAYNEQLATKQLEQQYAYEYGDLNSTNPTLQNIAIENAVAGMYENYPIQGMESQATKVQKVKDYMSGAITGSPMSGTEAIAMVEQEIRNSPGYQQLMEYQKSQMTPEATDKWTKLNDNQLYNSATGETKTITPTQSKVIDLQEGETGGQCGTFARQYTGISGSLNDVVGATASDRLKKFTDTEPQVGGLVFFSGGNYNKTYGHIAVIESINDDGTLNLVESNLNGDEKVTKRTISPSEVTGYYNQTPLAGNKTYTDNDIALLSSVTKLDKQGREVLKENGFTEQDWANFNAGLLPPTKSQQQQAQKVLNLANELATHPGLNNAVGFKGPIGSFTTVSGTDKADFEALFNTLVDSLASANLDKIKGAMSDKDIEFLRNIEKNGLSYESSEEQFKKKLQELSTTYSNVLNRGTKLQQETTITPTSSDEDLIKYLQSKQG